MGANQLFEIGTLVALQVVDATMLHGSQIAESNGSPLIPFDFLPSGHIPPPLPKRPAGGPPRAPNYLKLADCIVTQWDTYIASRC